MASILDRYGIKEVADVTFYDIDPITGAAKHPVLYLDTLKVSTIEQTAEQTDARGGKGNPKLITWDYGKDITVTLEDALFSAKSLAIMFGNGTVADTNAGTVRRTVLVRLVSDGATTPKAILPDFFTADVFDGVNKTAIRDKVYAKNAPSDKARTLESTGIKIERITSEKGNNYSVATFDSQGNITTSAPWTISVGSSGDAAEIGDRVFVTYTIPATTKEIVISADTFPGTYYVTGDTYARSDVTGDDQFFQFIIPKAKVTSENTITLEAEGDPSVFNMSLSVLRPEDGDMMKLVQYDLTTDNLVSGAGLE